ncbi:MAG: hypothetical protein HN392_10435 [Anaerolineae bacterium]|jgi:WD40 repeat protein|nr:hypothetical protein [Anaerolineae bacterium]MBT7074637.1 hypothetical protein [Anaerolineae bacterium]MBT7782856.1 hypothetical protein [Anaerolineae bacterium]
MKKIILLTLFFLLSACQTKSSLPATPTPLPYPTALAYIAPSPISPSILPPDSIDIEISSLFGKGTVSQVIWSPDGRIIAVGGAAGIRFYRSDTFEEIRFIPADYLITSIVFSPDGKMLASGSADRVFSKRAFWRRFSPWGSENNYVQLYDVETGEELAKLEGGFSYITSVAFSPDGKLLASGSMYSDDNAIRIWKLASILDGDLSLWQLHKQHTRGIFGIDFSPDGKTLLSGAGDNSARLWDIDGEKMKEILMYQPAAKVKVFAVDYSPVIGENGEELLALAGADFFHNTPTALLEIWDASSGELVFEIDGHDSSLDSVAFSPDGKILASGGSYSDNKIHLWSVQTGQHLRVLKGHFSGVRSLAFSPDGRTLASSGWDAILHLWDLKTGEIIASHNEHTSVVHSTAISPDGSILATGGDAGLIRLWDVETGEKIGVLNTKSSRITSLLFSDKRNLLIAGTDEPAFNIQMWDISSLERIDSLSGHESFVQVLSISSNQRYLASGGALGDNAVYIWDMENNGALLHTFDGHTRSVKSLAFSNNEKILATGDGKGTLRIIDIATGEIQYTIEAHDCAITALAFEPEIGSLLSGGCNGFVPPQVKMEKWT